MLLIWSLARDKFHGSGITGLSCHCTVSLGPFIDTIHVMCTTQRMCIGSEIALSLQPQVVLERPDC